MWLKAVQWRRTKVSDMCFLFPQLPFLNYIESLKIDRETWAHILLPTKYMYKRFRFVFFFFLKIRNAIMYLYILLVKEQAGRRCVCDKRTVFII